MSILIRAALLGGIAYLITRSLNSNSSMQRRSLMSGGRSSPRNELQRGENNIWPTSESQQTAATSVGPGA